MPLSVTATFVFTDLVDSTATAARLGPAKADELRQTHFRLLRGAVAASGGTEVKNLGDGLMVMFSSPSRAFAGAVGMQQAIEHHNRSTDEPLGVRIGISAGEAVEEDGDFFGDPVVEAARLCAAAAGGQILASDVVRLMAGRHASQPFVELGPLELKGLPEPVDVVEVVWEPLDAAEGLPPLPARLASSLSANFVGRAVEMERLETVWKAVTADDRLRVMLVGGEPGIGKTTLSARFACDRYADGVAVVYGRCDEDLGVPYQPWIEALTQLARHAPETLLAGHVEDRGGHLARLVPELSKRLRVEVPVVGDADTDRFVLFACVIDLLARVSHDHPLLVVLDDLHWADRASVQLLRHVAASDDSMRVGILGTFRDSDITTEHPLGDFLVALHRENRGVRISLRGFDDNDVLHLLETIAGHEMDEQGVALRDALLAETAGNPFFVAEILRHLAETGAIYQQGDGRWVADSDLRAVGLPVSVREVVGRRLAGLGSDTERVLALGAVIGRDFDIPLLAAVAHTDEDGLIDICDTAVAAAILQTTSDPDRYTFAHALIEHTLYDSLSPARRARAHKAVAEHLEAIGAAEQGRVGELAYHWSQAVQPTDLSKAIEYTALASVRALDQSAPDDALRWSLQALELLDRSPEPNARQRAAILVTLGTAQRQCGVAEYRETLLEAAGIADEVDSVDLLVRAAVANNRGFQSDVGRTDHERVAVLERALDRLGPEPTGDRARLLAVLAMERLYEDELDERRALVERAVVTARASGDDAAFVQAATNGCDALWSPSTLPMLQGLLGEAREVADRLGDGALRWSIHNKRMITALMQADGDAVVDAFEAQEQEASRIPHATIRWCTAYHGALLAIVRGELAEAEARAEAAFALGAETGHADAIAIFGPQLVNIRDHQGRLAEMLPLIEQAVVDSPGLPAYRAVLVNTMVQDGRHDEARTLLEQDLATQFAMRHDNAWSTALSNWARAAAALRHHDAIAAVRAQIAPYHDQVATTNVTIDFSLAHLLGLLDLSCGDWDSAERWFREALELHKRLRSPLLVAYTQAAWARTLAERAQGDDRKEASAMAEHSHAAAIAGGYGTIERDTRAVLEQLG